MACRQRDSSEAALCRQIIRQGVPSGKQSGPCLTGKCQPAPAGDFAHPSCSSTPTPALGQSQPMTIKAVVIAPMAKPLLVTGFIFLLSLFIWKTVKILLHVTSKLLGAHTYISCWKCLELLTNLLETWLLVSTYLKSSSGFLSQSHFSYFSWRYYFRYRTKNRKTQRKKWIYFPEKNCSLNFVLGTSRNSILLCFLSVIFPGRYY